MSNDLLFYVALALFGHGAAALGYHYGRKRGLRDAIDIVSRQR